MIIIHRVKQKEDEKSGIAEWPTVREHDGHENLSSRQCPQGFPRLRLALFNRNERNPCGMLVRAIVRVPIYQPCVIALAGISRSEEIRGPAREPINYSGDHEIPSCEIRVISGRN